MKSATVALLMAVCLIGRWSNRC